MSRFGDEFRLTLITNDPVLAARADSAGVDIIGVDIERLNKRARQGHIPNARISDHELSDIDRLAPVVRAASLFARLNPLHDGSKGEVESAIVRGATVLMLPFFKTAEEVEGFVRLVDGRARVVLLLETAASVVRLHDILAVSGIDEVMVGLNDLHLSTGVANHFELVTSDLMTMISEMVRDRGLRFGFGGLARAGDENLPIPSDLVLAQHARLASTSSWLSRSFFGPDSASIDLAARMSVKARAYVTYFDQRYLAFAIVMLRSLLRHDPQAEIFALCFDQTAHDIVAGLGEKNIVAVSHQAILDFEPALTACTDRARISFYATHKPVLPLYVLSQRPDIATISHIDADTYFFSSPAPLFKEIGPASIAVSPHGFSKMYEDSKKFGEFNAGFIHWRNDAVGLRCLADYRADCLQRCEPRIEAGGRYSNQGYLNTWPQRYPGVHVIRHPGVNLSWWNMAAHALTLEDVVLVDAQPLIFYHFSNLILDPLGIWRTFREFGDNLQLGLDAVYGPYLKEVERTDRWLRRRVPDLLPIERPFDTTSVCPVRDGPWPRSLHNWVERAKWFRDRQKRNRQM